MRKFWLSLLLILSAVLVLTGCALLGARDPVEPSMTVDVMLQECDGVTILGANPVSVPVGQDVSFAVDIRDGCKIDSLSQGAVYANGVVTLTDVKFPTTVEVTTRALNDLTLQVENDSQQGKLTSNIEMGTVREDTEVTVRVTPAEGLVFLGYSVGASRADGGAIACASTEYTFALTEDTVLYTNYYNIDSGRLVIYDGNGAAEGTQYYVFPKDSPYIGPNARANKGQFTRDGYVLCGYNTEPDGSGTYYGPGWSVILPEDPETFLTLYAQWMPVTEKEAFTYTVKNKGITITGYRGDHKTVVIPETIDGTPVVKIDKHAFQNGKFKTLYLSRNLKTIEEEAFLDCRALTTLYMCDTLFTMPDTAFTNCNELQKLNMLACVDPRYSTNHNGMYKIKYQRLLTAQGQKMIFHAGSNVSYGVDISTIHTMFDNAYAGVNFGCNYETPAVFFIEVAAAHMNPGDLLVLCPEYQKYQFGYNAMNVTTWQIFEGAYNAYADVDIRNYIKVFSSFAAFNTNRHRSGPRSYERYHTVEGVPSVTQLGDYNVNHDGQTPDLREDMAKWKAGRDKVALNLKLLSQDYNANMNRAIDLVLEKGGKVYISFASIMKDSVLKADRSDEHLNAFQAAVTEAFPKAAVISNPGRYIMDSKMFYNSGYHLTTAASKVRAKMLAEEILAQLEKEK